MARCYVPPRGKEWNGDCIKKSSVVHGRQQVRVMAGNGIIDASGAPRVFYRSTVGGFCWVLASVHQ